MQPVYGITFREQGEGPLQQLVPRPARASRGTVAGGSGTGSGGLQDPHRHSQIPREPTQEEQQELRRKINSRERKRMQDLNLAMDSLREVMVPFFSSQAASVGTRSGMQHPYLSLGAPPTGRRLSKISTLVLARNYILLLGSSLQEMRRLLGEVSISGNVPHLLLTGGWPLLTDPGQFLLTPPEQPLSGSQLPLNSASALEDSTSWVSRGTAGAPFCPCGVCRVPRMVHAPSTTRFLK